MTEAVSIEKLSQQLCELESQLTFQEDTIHSLNQVVTQQQQQIERLNEMMLHMRTQMESSLTSQPNEVVEDRPPHY